MKRVVMWAVLCAMPLGFAVLAALGWYSWGKLSYAGYACGSFAQLDDQLGWVLKPNATSCIGGRAPFKGGAPWFEAAVHTDANGFRSAGTGTQTPTGGVLFVGDSFTFGYGVTFEDSFPGAFEQQTGIPAVTAASPAYGSAQSILLAERWVERLKPRAIVYLDNGFWERSACRGRTRPEAILKPCYWQPPGAATAELVEPPPGRVTALAKWGVLPGGMVGAGEITWTYFLVSRPIAQVTQGLARFGLVPGQANDFFAVGVDTKVMRSAVLDHLARLGRRAGVPVLVLDPAGQYAPWRGALPAGLTMVTDTAWNDHVSRPSEALTPDDLRVPNDGHYGPGLNRLVAGLITKELAAAGALRTGNR